MGRFQPKSRSGAASPASVADTAKAAVLLASDRARMITGTIVNSTVGAALD